MTTFLGKLDAYFLAPSALVWFRSHLTARKYQVQVEQGGARWLRFGPRESHMIVYLDKNFL